MQRATLLMLLIVAGCATHEAPSPGRVELATTSVPPSEASAEKVTYTITRLGQPCRTNDPMPNAIGGSASMRVLTPRVQTPGRTVPIPNLCPVVARTGADAVVVTFGADSGKAAPRPPR
jgi:hypothetical protein